MFTWICPKCGREVPPSYSECPNCIEKQGAPEARAEGQHIAPPAEKPAARRVGPPQQQQAMPGYMSKVPGWLLAMLFAAGFVLTLSVGYFAYNYLQNSKKGPPVAVAGFEAPTLPSNAAVKAHPITEHIEISGLRLTENKQKAFVRFVVTNHSSAEVAGLAADVKLIAVTATREKETVGTFSFKVPSLGPYESKDLQAPVATKLRVYELPDWQFLRTDFQITAP